MDSADSMEKHIERKLLIAQLTQRFFDEQPGTKSISIWGSQIIKFNPLLENLNPFLVAVERVADELAPNFTIDTTQYNGWPDSILSIEIDNPKRLIKYISEKEVELAEIRNETRRRAFILDTEANLYLADSRLAPYAIERGSLRHKLIYYLAKDGGYMSAVQLADKLSSTPKRIRTTVGQLRDQIVDRFKVSGTDLIQSGETGSYKATTITLRVPKGYTP